MLAAGDSRVEGSSERKVEGHEVFMGTHDTEKVQSEFRQVEVLDGQLELHSIQI